MNAQKLAVGQVWLLEDGRVAHIISLAWMRGDESQRNAFMEWSRIISESHTQSGLDPISLEEAMRGRLLYDPAAEPVDVAALQRDAFVACWGWLPTGLYLRSVVEAEAARRYPDGGE